MSIDSTHEIDISVVVTAHAEGRLAHRTMRSIQAAIQDASAHGLRSEIIIALDTPTSETLSYFASWRDKANVLDVTNRDPGLNRNAAVAVARGKYVAIVDADDLLGRHWLTLAHKRAEQSTLPCFAVHAEITNYFGNRQELTRHLPSDSPAFVRATLFCHNSWTSLLFAPLTTFQKIPFRATPNDSGFGYEDWHWICEVIGVGGEIHIAAETCNFARYKHRGSRLSFHSSGRTLLRPTKLFEPREFLEKCVKRDQAPVVKVDVPSEKFWSNRKAAAKAWLAEMPQRISRNTEWCPPIQKTLGGVYRLWVGHGLRRSALPYSLLQQWNAIAEIEPQLFPSDRYLENTKWFSHPPEPAAGVYAKICGMIADCHPDVVEPQFTHVFLVPWLKTGGSDLETIHIMLLLASNPLNRLLVIATEDADSPWKDRLPSSVKFIEIIEVTQDLRVPKRRELIAQLLIYLEPKAIHLINSRLGNQIFEQYGKALSKVSQLYTTAFCADVEPNGALAGYAITSLPEYAEYLTAITSDNRRICDYLAETFAIDPAKMVVHYQPVVLKELPQRNWNQPEAQFNILWAGRLDRQKRPDLMLEIARRCQSDNMHFHVYGSSVIVDDRAKVDFSNSPNVTYHGPFEGLHSIEPAKFDLFLNTSQWDGMPNILLEAVAEGLPIVTSDVGGIRELIVQEETGLIVYPFDDIEQYVVALRRLKRDPELRERLLLASRQLVAERHSWEHFAKDLNQLPGYLEAPCQLELAELSLLENVGHKKPLEASS